MYKECSAPPQALSEERKLYLKKKKRTSMRVKVCQWAILAAFILLWELLARFGVIDSFIMSQPTRIIKTLLGLRENNLLAHIAVTCVETLAGFSMGVLLGNIIAFLLWWSDFFSRVAAPYLVILNALPKIALGPVIIIWVGAGTGAIIVMALAISLIVTVLEMLSGFVGTDPELVKMAGTFGASSLQTFFKIIFPSNLPTLFNSMKINIGLSLVGVIAGEFLVSKAGLGYLIVYGGQVFQMDLVMTSVLILALVAALLYRIIVLMEGVVLFAVSHPSTKKKTEQSVFK
ncbi:MAG: ABC transporter permease [Oscillospiraceae bacterium]|jgi:NitT/TauT family transport system permease protein|nr:ABC transporter permease [Oscillospiraceae bacterium]